MTGPSMDAPQFWWGVGSTFAFSVAWIFCKNMLLGIGRALRRPPQWRSKHAPRQRP